MWAEGRAWGFLFGMAWARARRGFRKIAVAAAIESHVAPSNIHIAEAGLKLVRCERSTLAPGCGGRGSI